MASVLFASRDRYVIDLAVIRDRPQWENELGFLAVIPIHQHRNELLVCGAAYLVPPFLAVPVALCVTLALKENCLLYTSDAADE